MTAPVLRSLADIDPLALRDLPVPLSHPGLALFVVVREGLTGGHWFSAGEVLVCRGEARSGDATVLVARHGHPRVGRVQAGRLVGDGGEPCHTARWQSAGRLVAVWRRGACGWVAELAEREAETAAVGATPVEAAHPAEAARQLSLFAA